MKIDSDSGVYILQGWRVNPHPLLSMCQSVGGQDIKPH